jgi:hypothetical protein
MAKFKRYIPKSSYTEPKYTLGREYTVKDTGEEYVGYYIEASRGKFYSGKSPQQGGGELLKIEKERLINQGARAGIFALLATLAKGFFKPKLSSIDRERGFTIRYFIQDKKNNKIVETDKETYVLAQKELINRRFVEADWVIKGPAEDQVLNGYPFEGAISKNKKTIEKLEMQIPGISTYVTDYKFLVTEPITPNRGNPIPTETYTEQDPQTELENSRKANFDLRK